jgi:hypothetical protein
MPKPRQAEEEEEDQEQEHEHMKGHKNPRCLKCGMDSFLIKKE